MMHLKPTENNPSGERGLFETALPFHLVSVRSGRHRLQRLPSPCTSSYRGASRHQEEQRNGPATAMSDRTPSPTSRAVTVTAADTTPTMESGVCSAETLHLRPCRLRRFRRIGQPVGIRVRSAPNILDGSPDKWTNKTDQGCEKGHNSRPGRTLREEVDAQGLRRQSQNQTDPLSPFLQLNPRLEKSHGFSMNLIVTAQFLIQLAFLQCQPAFGHAENPISGTGQGFIVFPEMMRCWQGRPIVILSPTHAPRRAGWVGTIGFRFRDQFSLSGFLFRIRMVRRFGKVHAPTTNVLHHTCIEPWLP